eukprot:426638-Amphidinium_carterae.1
MSVWQSGRRSLRTCAERCRIQMHSPASPWLACLPFHCNRCRSAQKFCQCDKHMCSLANCTALRQDERVLGWFMQLNLLCHRRAWRLARYIPRSRVLARIMSMLAEVSMDLDADSTCPSDVSPVQPAEVSSVEKFLLTEEADGSVSLVEGKLSAV